MKINLPNSLRNTEHPSSSYHLPEAHRQAILEGADNPHHQISRAKLAKTEQQRQRFIAKHGNDSLGLNH